MTLPLLWLAAALVLSLASSRPVTAPTSPAALYQANYLLAHRLFHLSLPAALAGFSAIYLVLEGLNRIRYRRGLGYAHLALICLGSLLIVAPSLTLDSVGLPQRHADPIAAFSFWNAVSATGYAMMLAGLLAFFVMLGDAVRLTFVRRVAG